MQRVKLGATDAFQPIAEPVSGWQFDRRGSAFVIDGVDQSTVFIAHVDRVNLDACVFKPALGAQQKPCADGVEPLQSSAIDLHAGETLGIEGPHKRIEPARFADHPKPTDDHAQRISIRLKTVPGPPRRLRLL